jgi:hypothetical protein
MKTAVSLGIHAVFLSVYVAVIGAHVAGWEDARDAAVVVGLGLAGLGLMTCGALWGLASRCRETRPENWRALGMLGVGLFFLVTAAVGAGWIVSNRQAILQREQERRDADRERRGAIQAMIERRPFAEVQQARTRAAILKDALAGHVPTLIDSVRSGLDGSRIDASQRTLNSLEAEIGSFNPYTSAAAYERARKLEAEFAIRQAEQRAAIEAIQRQAEDLVLAGVERGDLWAFRQIQEQIARRPGAFREAERRAFERASPSRTAVATKTRQCRRPGHWVEEGRTQPTNP